MKLHKISQDNLMILGFGPNQIEQKHFFNKNNLMTFAVCGLCSILTFLFLIYEAKMFVEYVEATYILSAAIGCTVALASLRVKTLSKYIEELEKIVDSRQTSTSKAIYAETNRQVENWSRIISFLGMKVIPLCGVLSMLVPSFLFYFTTDWGKDAFKLPVPMWYPFDWRDPFGYLIAVFIQYIIALYGFTFFAAMLSLGLGSYCFTTALVTDINGILQNIDDCAKSKRKRTRIIKQLFEFIEFHSDVKQAIKHFSEVYQLVFAALFSWSLVTICGAMLMIQTEILSHHETNSLILIVMVMEVLCAFGWLLTSCEIGERFESKFNEIGNVIDQFKWYSFPIEVQQMLPIIILITQQPVTLEVFGSISCLRESFKKVINTACSYFMVLREFSV